MQVHLFGHTPSRVPQKALLMPHAGPFRPAEDWSHACRVDKEMHPTDWLEALPQSTLVDLMQRRCSLVGGRIRGSVTNVQGTRGSFILTNEEVMHYEAKIRL